MDFYILPDNKGFYDPDGYLFNSEGFDEFGGYYDEEGQYFPGDGNKHLYPELTEDKKEKKKTQGKKKDIDDDELIRQFEA